MAAARKSRAQALDEFLLEYLPCGTDDLEHEIAMGVVEAVRRKIVMRLVKAGHLMAEDDDDHPSISAQDQEMREAC